MQTSDELSAKGVTDGIQENHNRGGPQDSNERAVRRIVGIADRLQFDEGVLALGR